MCPVLQYVRPGLKIPASNRQYRGTHDARERDSCASKPKLDASGEPYAFGVRGDDTGSLTGPRDFIRNGIHHPRWISSADGTWRAAVKALDFNVPLHESMFVRPVDH